MARINSPGKRALNSIRAHKAPVIESSGTKGITFFILIVPNVIGIHRSDSFYLGTHILQVSATMSHIVINIHHDIVTKDIAVIYLPIHVLATIITTVWHNCCPVGCPFCLGNLSELQSLLLPCSTAGSSDWKKNIRFVVSKGKR